MKTSGQGKAGQVEAIYEAIQALVLQKLAAATREAKAGDKLSYHTIWRWVCEATRELMQPNLFPGTEGIDQAIKEYGPEVYLDDIMRQVILGEPGPLTIARTPLTPEVIATLNDTEQIYRRLFIKAPADIDIEKLLTREITLPPTDPARYKVDLNFLRYPIFSLRKGKKAGNRKEYEGIRTINGKQYRVVTAFGTTDGVLTPFDYDVLFRGICSYIRHDEITGRWYADFTTPDLLNRLGKPTGKGGGFYNMVYNSLLKVATFNIRHSTYISGPEGDPEYITENMFDKSANPQKREKKKPHRFIFTASLGQALSNKYTRSFDRREIKNLPDPISKRVYEVLSDLLAHRKSQVIGIGTLAERIPIEDSNKARRRSKVIKALDAQERFTYTLEGDTLTIRKDAPGRTRTAPEVKVEEDTPAEALKDLTIGLGSQAQAKPDTRTESWRDWDKEREKILNYLRVWNIPEEDLPEISLDPNRPGNNKVEKWKDKLTESPGAFKTITEAIKHLEENLPEK